MGTQMLQANDHNSNNAWLGWMVDGMHMSAMECGSSSRRPDRQ